MLKAYETCVQRAPVVTNCVTGFIIAAVGDYLSQKYFEEDLKPAHKDFKWNVTRSFNMGVLRAFVITPVVLQWYPFLARVCPGSSLFRVLGRVALDQSFGSPLVIGLVFAGNALLTRDLPNLPRTFREQFFVTWVTGLKYWPFVHSVTFGLVPLRHQPIFAHFASVYWNAVLSYYANLDMSKAALKKDEDAV